MLEQWAGKDCTEEFMQYHQDWDHCLEYFDYLRIGRIVPEKSAEALTHQEIAIHGSVYGLESESRAHPPLASTKH